VGDNSDEFQEMLRKFLESGEHFDITELAKAAGLPGDSATIEKMLGQLHDALSTGNEGITEKMVRDSATTVANHSAVAIDAAIIGAANNALKLATLWLDDITAISPLTATDSSSNGTAHLPLFDVSAEPCFRCNLAKLWGNFRPRYCPGAISGCPCSTANWNTNCARYSSPKTSWNLPQDSTSHWTT